MISGISRHRRIIVRLLGRHIELLILLSAVIRAHHDLLSVTRIPTKPRRIVERIIKIYLTQRHIYSIILHLRHITQRISRIDMIQFRKYNRRRTFVDRKINVYNTRFNRTLFRLGKTNSSSSSIMSNQFVLSCVIFNHFTIPIVQRVYLSIDNFPRDILCISEREYVRNFFLYSQSRTFAGHGRSCFLLPIREESGTTGIFPIFATVRISRDTRFHITICINNL